MLVVRVIFGAELDRGEARDVEARTLGEALEQLEGLAEEELRVFVDGVDAERLEGDRTPVGDEDTVLLTRW